MNWYWRYEQVDGGVIVELESLTLSRSIPLGLGMVVEPIINRIARESIYRTLDSMRRLYGGRGDARWRLASMTDATRAGCASTSSASPALRSD